MITASDVIKCRSILQTVIDCLYANRTIDQRAMAHTLERAKGMISHTHTSGYSLALELEQNDEDFYAGYDCELCGGMRNPDLIRHAVDCPNRDEKPSSQEPIHVGDFM